MKEFHRTLRLATAIDRYLPNAYGDYIATEDVHLKHHYCSS